MYDPLKAKTRVVVFIAVALLFGVGIASGLGWTSTSHAMPPIVEGPQVSEAAVQPALDLSRAFTNLADAVTPAVVRIESRRSAPAPDPRQNQFRQFFDGQDQEEGEPAPPRSQIAGGSGFVVSSDGYILTNNHVVEGSTDVRVYFPDRRYYRARIIGADPFTDVAVIKVDLEEDLQAMALGNSDEINVGEWILAIGNPGFGASTQLDFTVTAGIISARGRGLNLLQRDLFKKLSTTTAVSVLLQEAWMIAASMMNFMTMTKINTFPALPQLLRKIIHATLSSKRFMKDRVMQPLVKRSF